MAARSQLTAGQVEAAYGASPEVLTKWCLAHGLGPLPAPRRGEDGVMRWSRRQLGAFLGRLYSAREVAELFGWRAEVPRQRWFAAADRKERKASGRAGRPVEYWWYLSTVIRWDLARPGRSGRHAGSDAYVQDLPEVTLGGDPDELLISAQVAALLGFSSVSSFNASRRNGTLAALEEPDEEAWVPEGSSRAQRAWKRGRVEAEALRRGGAQVGAQEDLLDEEAVARELGFAGADSFRAARQGGRAQRLYRRERVERERARRAGQAAGAGAGDELVPVDEVAALLGYGSAREFARAVREGRESALGEADEVLPPAAGKGRPRRAYRRHRVDAVVAARQRH
ncbi:hypothetical protein [Streptomyces noursei]|uniref:hypothetical protein n=1 Tax=Streptomyces noursei TaxID=1971 RepID=UPI001672D404|nr:hypothetical protein [Streptomyces noursei]MCZ1021089.1 hypothetical protein [Streptomyces noursei]GGX51618.1 hypothetical protein GCM10010341_86410 [Streptomyces noursei]